MDEPILTKKQVAERLQVSTRTVTNLNLPHLKVGGQNRYFWSQIEAHLAVQPRQRPQKGKAREMTTCECGDCKCEGKAVIDWDEYEGLVKLAHGNVQLIDAAQQIISISKENDFQTTPLFDMWISRMKEAIERG